MVDADESAVSYAELGRDCDALPGALRADGVGPGDRVAMLDLNSRWLLAAHFAVPGPRQERSRRTCCAIAPGTDAVIYAAP